MGHDSKITRGFQNSWLCNVNVYFPFCFVGFVLNTHLYLRFSKERELLSHLYQLFTLFLTGISYLFLILSLVFTFSSFYALLTEGTLWRLCQGDRVETRTCGRRSPVWCPARTTALQVESLSRRYRSQWKSCHRLSGCSVTSLILMRNTV